VKAKVTEPHAATPGTIDTDILPSPHANNPSRVAFEVLPMSLAVDEGLELLEAIEDRLYTHLGTPLVSMKRGDSILAERCPRM